MREAGFLARSRSAHARGPRVRGPRITGKSLKGSAMEQEQSRSARCACGSASSPRSSSCSARWWSGTATASARSWGSTARRPATSRSTSACFICIASTVNLVMPRWRSDGREAVRHLGPAEAWCSRAGAVRRLRGADRQSWYSLGIYVASALYIAGFMRWLGKYRLARRSPRSSRRHDGRVLRHVRDLVPGAAAQGAARSRCSGSN